MKSSFVLILVVFVFNFQTSAQEFLNLDLEFRNPSNPRLPYGFVGAYDANGKWTIGLDSTVVHKGRFSLKMSSADLKPGHGQSGFAVPLKLVRGKHVKFGGWVKTNNLQGSASIDFNMFTPRGVQSDTLVNKPMASGTTDWTYFSTEFTVDSDATLVGTLLSTSGKGTAWYDDLDLIIDGKPYSDVKPKAFGLSSSQSTSAAARWIRHHAKRLNTFGLADLEPFKKIVGHASIVGLGEPTHGTKEAFQMKYHLVQFLVTQMGFSLFAVEVSMAEAQRLNSYILDGRGDPKALIAGMYFWIWRTGEFLKMVQWMRDYNQTASKKIVFTGIDMQAPNLAIENVRDFVTQVDSGWLDSLNLFYPDHCDILKLLEDHDTLRLAKTYIARVKINDARRVYDHLQASRNVYLSFNSASDVEWIEHNALLVLQSAIMMSRKGNDAYTYRDSCMAQNLEWLTNRYPAKKIMVWAHNDHVARAAGMFGSRLAKRFGRQYVPIGFAFHSGQYTALDSSAGSWVPTAVKAQVSEPGTIEWLFHQSGLKQSVLDVRDAGDSTPGSAWLSQTLRFGTAGARKVPNRFLPIPSLKEYFDALVYFDHTNATTIFPSPFGW